MDKPISQKGPWGKVKLLGSGAFGEVTLWLNSETGEKIALKKLHDEASINTKQLERWCNEVDIMKKLNHANIIGTLKVPVELSSITSIPVLAMEYCSLGNLREELNKGENSCGLKEPEVINILRDVSSGLAYLHSCKIIHRDLKPENIVLQQKDSQTVYKIIDLGYAKAFDQSSLSKSFVGTIQYIAPELFMGKAYTSSVDYWSFGLLTHEIITGHRPFLPGFSPSVWMKEIQNKARDLICVLEKPNGKIVFGSKISRKNYISGCLLEEIEKWLQLALDWNGQTRGRHLETKQLLIFEDLTTILCKKIINVFWVSSCETLSYEITPETSILELKIWLQRDTHVEVEDQLLLLPSGKVLNSQSCILSFIKHEKPNKRNVFLFLYNTKELKMTEKATEISLLMKEICENSRTFLSFSQLKMRFAESIYFLQTQSNKCANLLEAIKIKINHTKQKTLEIESLYEEIGDEWNEVENFCKFLCVSHKIDLENYIFYRKTGKLKSVICVKKWIQNVIDINKKVAELKTSYNKNEQRQMLLLARQRCQTLEVCSENKPAEATFLDEIVYKGHLLWESLQKLNKEEREKFTQNNKIVILVTSAFEKFKRFVNSDVLSSLFQKITETDENLNRFQSHLTTLLKSLKLLKLVIENTQKERQKDIWNLFENLKTHHEEEEEEKGNSDKHTAFEKGLCNLQIDSTDDKVTDKEFSQMEGSVKFDLSAPLQNYSFKTDAHDTYSIISDNNLLRFRIQEVQQSYSQILQEINSLNWNYL